MNSEWATLAWVSLVFCMVWFGAQYAEEIVDRIDFVIGYEETVE